MTEPIKLPPLPRLQVPRIDADIDLMDIRRLVKWAEYIANTHARAAIEADRQARGEPDTEREKWLASLFPEDRMFEEIDQMARESYKRHHSSTRGQMLVRADSWDSHVVWATKRWIEENAPLPTAPQPQQQASEPVAWLRSDELRKLGHPYSDAPLNSKADSMMLHAKGTQEAAAKYGHDVPVFTAPQPQQQVVEPVAEVPEGWREQFKEAVYDNLAAADNQDVPLEEYPDRILGVLNSIVGPRHPTVVLWRNDAIKTCMSIAYKYCRDPETYRYLKQDFEALITTTPQPQQHPDDAAVDAFAAAMKAKLAKKRADGRGGWQECNAEYLSELLREHVEKGDPVDVANLAMMLHQNRQSIQPAPQPQQQASEPLFWYRPIADGMYEGPVHNNSVGGKMLRDEKPGEWKPLHGAPQPQQIPEGYKKAIQKAYGHLWMVNNEPGTPHQYSPEEAAYKARRLLRELLTKEERGDGINSAMLEAAPEPGEKP